MDDMVNDLKARLARKVDREKRLKHEADPFGFRDMSEEELEDWIGGGNAQPGSQRFIQAQTILDGKRSRRLLVDGLHSQPEVAVISPGPNELERPALRGIHLSLLMLPIAGFGAAFAATASVTWGFITAAVLLVLVLASPVRDPMLRWLDRRVE